MDHIERLLKESFAFNNYFDECRIDFLEWKTATDFTMPDIKLCRTENPHHHVRNFIHATSLKGIDKEVFHLIFP